MENEKKKLTPEESLELITKTIASLKSSYRQNNYYFLLWGWMISLASITHFIILKILFSLEAYKSIILFSLLTWAVFILAGVIIQYIHIYRIKREKKVTSHIEKYMSVLWQISGAAMIMTGIISMLLDIYPVPFILTISGLATVVTGIQIKYNPLVYGGIIMFLCAFAAAFFLNEYQLLISAFALISGYLVPGYMLKSSKD